MINFGCRRSFVKLLTPPVANFSSYQLTTVVGTVFVNNPSFTTATDISKPRCCQFSSSKAGDGDDVGMLNRKGKSQLFDECDLKEEFVRGWGPGGQSVNTTSNCVVLKHQPTGIVVKCQTTRILAENRKLARQWLHNRLDELVNGRASEIVQSRVRHLSRQGQAHSRAKRRLAGKQAFKARVDEGTEEV